jgi:two-component system CheB/CheR fusion protein
MALKKINSLAPSATKQDFRIVGIGASAGGIDAFKRFLKAIPLDSGMAYVLVQHLDPSHQSILPDILSRVTKIPVLEITNDIHLAPNHIYVIPENKTLTSTDGILKLTTRNKTKTNSAINVFFISLAEVHQSLAVGVVLSGVASDGTLGLKAIKAHGGITFAQDQKSAGYGEMPQNAVNAEVVDFVLPPEKIPGKLLQIIATYKKSKSKDKHLFKNDETVFKHILFLIHQRSGVDFTYYKQTTIQRRLARRMAISEKVKLSDYLKFLRRDKTEQDALFRDLLIPVTAFFRDPKIFKTISETIFPLLLKNKTVSNPIRMWIAGCSTGEEAYSLAISLHQFLGTKFSNRRIQIFASDISESAITKARMGIYHQSELENISAPILKKYFTKKNERYQVNKEIRDICVFAVHNFLKDPPFAKMDLISCRNALIYMDTFLQKKALNTFHYALKDTGFLFLGKSETTGPASELFTAFAKSDKIYLRKLVPGRFIHVTSERKEEAFFPKIKKKLKAEGRQTDFSKSAEAILLSKYTPASVVVNDQMDIVHINGNIISFLGPSQGKPTFNLLKMAREGLAFDLRNALHKAKIRNTVIIKEGIPVKTNGKTTQVTIEVLPLTNTVELHFLILFRKTIIKERKGKKVADSFSKKTHTDGNLQRVKQLERELEQTHEDMRSITEEQEASNEELQSANEELLSGSEELQSLNEELETAKEELQSSNEELIIINQELLDKQEQVNESRQYTEAIFATIREPLVILDRNLRIKTINTSFSKKFNVTEFESEGKLIYEIQNHLFDNTMLRSLLEKILPQRTEMNDYEIVINLLPLGECNMLLNARHVINEKNKEQLILLAIEDITERKILTLATQSATKIAEEAKRIAESATVRAEDAAKAKQQFLSNMSHEIRTPMNAIIGFTKVLLRTNLSDKQKEYLTAVKISGDSLIVLINDILDLAKVDAGKMIFTQTPFKMALSISAMLHLFETKIQEKNLELITEYDNKIPEVLLGDAVRLHQIILNLVSNAVKFTSKGKIVVWVHLISENEEQATIEFSITDTGIGIPENKMESIFEKFQQAGTETSSLYGGTGLGLAIVKQLVEPQGGKISVKSEVGVGSTFSIVLSFKKTQNKIDPESGVENAPNNQERIEIKNVEVLVVEDIALNQLLMRTLLNDSGFDCEIASNGKIAIEKLKNKTYDIILMDLQMPEMNGFEATEYIRNKMHSKTPIIALTADVTTVDLKKCKAVGMNDYLAKPVDEKLLYNKILELTNKPGLKTPEANPANEHIESKKIKCVNLDHLLRITKSNPTSMMEIISAYLEQTPKLIQAMNQSLTHKDWKALQSAAHKMTPSFSIMGIDKASENICKKIQKFSGEQQQTNEISNLVLQLGNVCAQACKELEEEFNAIKKIGV